MADEGCDMVTLDWEPYLRDEPVRRAYDELRRLAPDKGVVLHPLPPDAKPPHPFWTASRDAIHVVIDVLSPLVSHSIVHELVHALHMAEGYHRLTGNLLRRFPTVPEILSNEFQHPDVFRRMEAFGLVMDPYWDRWAALLRQSLEDMRWEWMVPYAGFKQLPRVYPWFFLPPDLSAPLLAEYSRLHPDRYQAALGAYEETKSIGFQTAERHRQCLGIFKGHWLRYCETHLPKDETGLPLVEAVRGSATKSVAELFATLTEEDVARVLTEGRTRLIGSLEA